MHCAGLLLCEFLAWQVARAVLALPPVHRLQGDVCCAPVCILRAERDPNSEAVRGGVAPAAELPTAPLPGEPVRLLRDACAKTTRECRGAGGMYDSDRPCEHEDGGLCCCSACCGGCACGISRWRVKAWCGFAVRCQGH